MRAVPLMTPVVATFVQVRETGAHACNNRHRGNSSGHLVHSSSCGRESPSHAAVCLEGGYSYSEPLRGACSRDGVVAQWE